MARRFRMRVFARIAKLQPFVSPDGTLTDADFRGCRWIEGDPSPLHPGMFCGFPVPPGES